MEKMYKCNCGKVHVLKIGDNNDCVDCRADKRNRMSIILEPYFKSVKKANIQFKLDYDKQKSKSIQSSVSKSGRKKSRNKL